MTEFLHHPSPLASPSAQLLQVSAARLCLVYGGTNIVFAADYSQFEPVGQTTVYSGKDCSEFHQRVNAYIELDGTW